MRNRYRLRSREAVRDPSTSFALLTSLRMAQSAVRRSCKRLPNRNRDEKFLEVYFV